MVEYTKEQFRELYQDLPKELQQAMGSERTIDTTERLLEEEGLEGEAAQALIKGIGDVLLGLLEPSKFQQELEKAGVEEEGAKKINDTVQRFVFYPVRKTLSELYEEEIEAKGLPKTGPEPEKTEKEEKAEPRDKYREPIE